jgi:hypothetical protein
MRNVTAAIMRRLEARWLAWCDQRGWPFEYEALYLEGYIPDVLLLGMATAPVLVDGANHGTRSTRLHIRTC